MSESLTKEDMFVIKALQLPKVIKNHQDIVTDTGVDINTQHIVQDPDNREDLWLTIRGKTDEDVKSAKTMIIAFCNPAFKEMMHFPGFPFMIFYAFKGEVKRKLQKQFGVVLAVRDDDYVVAFGEQVDAASALSKILNMLVHSNDTSDEEKQAALQFDEYVGSISDEYAEELYELSNLLKKDILEILDISVEVTVPKPEPKPEAKPTSSTQVKKVLIPAVVSSAATDDIIELDSSSQDDIISLTSGEESDDNKESEDNEDISASKSSRKLDYDSCDMPGLPPNFVLKAWMQANYEGTSNPNDFVNKSDILAHFRNHFVLPDHPELSNVFFDRLAVRIFPSDSNYRSVKTKRTKSKHCKRRLICLRRRNLDAITSSLGAAGVFPSTSHAISSSTPSTSTSVYPVSSTMKDWNSGRAPSLRLPVPEQPAIRPHASGSEVKQVYNEVSNVPFSPRLGQPYQITQHHMRKPSPPDIRPEIGQWCVSGTSPAQRRPPAMRRSHNPSGAESIAVRVASMSNNDLIRSPRPTPDLNLRPVVIDGSNIAVSHGNRERFSCRGIALCARYFIERGHKDVVCMVPNYRKGGGGNPPSFDASVLIELEQTGIVKLTPSRRVAGQNIVCYDDRFIVELAAMNGGVIVSNDQYRDLMTANPQWRQVIETQLLQYTVVGDLFMFPQDPLGKHGPTLDHFLRTGRQGKSQKQVSRSADIPGFYPQQQRSQPIPIAPPTNAWNNQPPQTVMMLSPRQNLILAEMTMLLPGKEREIESFIKRNPRINDVADMMDRFLQIQDS